MAMACRIDTTSTRHRSDPRGRPALSRRADCAARHYCLANASVAGLIAMEICVMKVSWLGHHREVRRSGFRCLENYGSPQVSRDGGARRKRCGVTPTLIGPWPHVLRLPFTFVANAEGSSSRSGRRRRPGAGGRGTVTSRNTPTHISSTESTCVTT